MFYNNDRRVETVANWDKNNESCTKPLSILTPLVVVGNMQESTFLQHSCSLLFLFFYLVPVSFLIFSCK